MTSAPLGSDSNTICACSGTDGGGGVGGTTGATTAAEPTALPSVTGVALSLLLAAKKIAAATPPAMSTAAPISSGTLDFFFSAACSSSGIDKLPVHCVFTRPVSLRARGVTGPVGGRSRVVSAGDGTLAAT